MYLASESRPVTDFGVPTADVNEQRCTCELGLDVAGSSYTYNDAVPQACSHSCANNLDGHIKLDVKAAYRMRNREKLRQKQAKYRCSKRYELANKQAKYRSANSAIISQKQAERRASKRTELAKEQTKYRSANQDKVLQTKAMYKIHHKDNIQSYEKTYYKKKFLHKRSLYQMKKLNKMVDFRIQHQILMSQFVKSYKKTITDTNLRNDAYSHVLSVFSRSVGMRNFVCAQLKINVKAVHTLMEKVNANGLLHYWGNQHYHSSTNELPNFDKSTAKYMKMDEFKNQSVEKVRIVVINNKETDNIVNDMANADEQNDDNDVSKCLVRPCGSSILDTCPNDSAARLTLCQRIDDKLPKLNPDMTVAEIRQLIEKYEFCNVTHDNDQHCIGQTGCTSEFGFLKSIAVHSPKLRTLLRKIYKVRSLCIWLNKYNEAVFNGDWTNFENLTDVANIERAIAVKFNNMCTGFNDVEHTDADVIHKYGNQVQRFQSEITNYKIQHCHICKLRKYSKELKVWDNWNSRYFKTAVAKDAITANYSLPCTVCTTCTTHLRNSGVPSMASINGLGVAAVPKELADLNTYERILVQRAKCFVNVIKLVPYSFKGNISACISAIKGIAIHLPLPMDGTINRTMDTLPALQDDMLKIVVDSLPSRKQIIWRSMVDMSKVLKALDWLAANNVMYADVKINRYADTENENIVECSGVNNAKFDNLLLKSNAGITYEHHTVKDMNPCLPADTDLALYKMKRVEGDFIADNDKKLELLCFPCLYPTGQFGIFVDNRPFGAVKPYMFIRNRLNHSDSRFRRDIQYLMFCLDKADKRGIDSGIYAIMKTTKNSRMTISEFRRRLHENDRHLEGNLNMMMANVRGSKQFWSRKCSDLMAMDEKFGPAHLFLTLSCAEYFWPDLREFLEKLNADIPDISRKRTNELCADDVVAVSEHFHHRFTTFMKEVVKHTNSPFGIVEHFFWRLEYQMRGAPHVHMKLWIKDGPIMDRDDKYAIQTFIQSMITCRMPSNVESPVLSDLVLRFQRHVCSGSCKRQIFSSGRFYTRCRFGFPRPIGNFNLLSVNECIKSRHKGRAVKKLYKLDRRQGEECINDYNPVVLYVWKANVDIQYIGEDSMILNRYVTSYQTKSEKTETEGIWAEIDKSKSIYSRYKSVGLKLMGKRDTGAYEAADKLLGHHFYGCSESLIWIGADLPSYRSHRFRPQYELDKLKPYSTDLYYENMVENWYPNRPDSMEHMCLYELASKYEHVNPIGNSNFDDDFRLRNNLGYFKSVKERIVKSPNIRLTADTCERYHHNLLILFKPWRDEEKDLLGGCETYKESFEQCANHLSEMVRFQNVRKRLENALEQAKHIQNEPQSHDNDDHSCGDHVEALAVDDANVDLPCMRDVNEDALRHKENKLNEVQRKIYDDIVAGIDKQDKHWDNSKPYPRCSCDDCPQVLKFVSGVGGTGKSFLINVLADKIQYMYPNDNGPSVVISAPTGMAAFQLNGMTVHRMLKLKVQHGKTPVYDDLPKDFLKMLRMGLQYVRLIIIDEISMVSHLQLAFIHLRLCQLFCDFAQGISPFGRMNIVVFGDLLQLPPVREKPVFNKVTHQDAQRSCIGVSSHHLWRYFKYDELTVNMRQKEDLDNYVDMLGRIRLGSPLDSDIEILNKHRIDLNGKASIDQVAYKMCELIQTSNLSIVCIMPLNESVEKFNAAMLNKLGINTVELMAIDSNMRQTKCQKKTIRKKLTTKKTSDTAGLETVLKVGVNARVMLKRNIDLEKGLCNGAMGTVKQLNYEFGKITSIDVLFESTNQIVAIKRVKADYELSPSVFITREQYPLCIAYAISIHKSQGISVDGVVVDLGTGVFADGMAYVALSRARKLCNVYLIDLDPTSLIMCDSSAWREYNYLRETINMGPLPLCNVRPNSIGQAKKATKKSKFAINIDSGMVNLANPKKARTEKTVAKPYISLINERNACFVNSTMQVIRQLVLLVEHIQSTDDVAIREISDIISSSGTKSVANLRNILGGRFNNGTQQCAHDFWKHIYQLFSKKIKQLFTFEENTWLSCTRKHEHNCPRLHNDECYCASINGCGTCTHITDVKSDLTLQPVNGRQQFKSLLKTDVSLIKRCDLCGIDTEHFGTVNHVFPTWLSG